MFLQPNQNENTTYQNLRDTTKSLLRGRFIAIVSILKPQLSHTNDLKLHLKILANNDKLNIKPEERKT
jgi:hypothetical protein